MTVFEETREFPEPVAVSFSPRTKVMILGIVLLAAVAAWVVILTYWRITVPVLMALVLLLVLLEIQSKEKWANGMSRIENSKP